MDDIVFRKAVAADYPAICELFTSREEMFLIYPAGQFPMTTSQLEEIARKRIALTVATENGKIIGFANLYDHQAGRHAFLGNVVIEKAARGRKLGEKLIRYMMKHSCMEYPLEELHLSVFNSNTPALLLYSGLDFIPYATEERYDPDGNRVVLIHMRHACKD